MKNKNLIAYAILAVCWEQLLEHARGNWTELNPNFWVSAKQHSICANPDEPDAEQQPLYIIRDILLQWILDSLDEDKIVILYTCRDNALISIDDPKEFPGDLDMFDDSEFPELKHILYIAKD